MITYTGESVFPKNNIAPSIFSVGVSLARLPRFTGHTRDWYSVLCHTMVVTELMSKKHRIHGVLHDAPEACVADVPTPWKTVAAKKREAVLLKRIYRDLGLALPTPMEAEAVTVADRAALAAEAHVLGHPAADEYWANPSKKAVELTEKAMEDCAMYRDDPQLAGTAYVNLVNLYVGKNATLALIPSE